MSDFKKLIDKAMVGGKISPQTPTSYDVWSLAHCMISGETASSDKPILIEHPTLGTGSVTNINQNKTSATVTWNNFATRAKSMGSVSLKEAKTIIVTNVDKYSHKLVEETTVDNMTLDEYLLLESDLDVPDAKDTILTGVDNFKTDTTPLAGMAGGDGKTNEPREEDGADYGGFDLNIATLDASSGGAADTAKKPAAKKSAAKKSAAKKSAAKKSAAKKPAAKTDSIPDKMADAKEDGDVENLTPKAKKTDKDTTEVDEALTLEDFDTEGVLKSSTMECDCDDNKENEYMENDDEFVTNDGISVTKEFLVKLIVASSVASLDDGAASTIADAISDASMGDVLDVDDIGDVMAKLQGSNTDEDIAPGDGDIAGDEGGEEYEGETQLMGGGGYDDREDAMESVSGKRNTRRRVTEGKVTNAILGAMMKFSGPKFGRKLYDQLKAEEPEMYRELVDMYKMLLSKGAVTDVAQMRILQDDSDALNLAIRMHQWANDKLPPEFDDWAEKKSAKLKAKGVSPYVGYDSDDDDDDYTESRNPNRRRKNGKKADPINEAWLAGIPYVGTKKRAKNADGLNDDEAEMAEIQRLAGMHNPNSRLF